MLNTWLSCTLPNLATADRSTHQTNLTDLMVTQILRQVVNIQAAFIEEVVYRYIKANPGLRLYQIDKGTLKSHHNWGAKYYVERLENSGRVFVKREHHGEKFYPDGSRVWPLYYAVETIK